MMLPRDLQDLAKTVEMLVARSIAAETRVNVLEKEVENNMLNIRRLTRDSRLNIAALGDRVESLEWEADEKVDRSEWKINGQP